MILVVLLDLIGLADLVIPEVLEILCFRLVLIGHLVLAVLMVPMVLMVQYHPKVLRHQAILVDQLIQLDLEIHSVLVFLYLLVVPAVPVDPCFQLILVVQVDLMILCLRHYLVGLMVLAGHLDQMVLQVLETQLVQHRLYLL